MSPNSAALVTVSVVCLFLGCCEAEVFKIGAIFESKNDASPTTLIKAFDNAVTDINENDDYYFQFEPLIRVIDDNPYDAMINTCALLEEGVIAIFGPFLEDNSNVVQSISDMKEIPHIEVRWDDHPLNGTILNVHPYPDVLTRTYMDIIETWGWKDFVILYENNESLQRVGELLKLFDPTKHKIIIRQLKDEYRTVLKELWRSGATHFVLDCTIDILPEVLRQAQQVGLMTNRQHYIITNLDLHTIDLVPYRYGETNITGMRFVDPDDANLTRVAAKIYDVGEGMNFVAGWFMRLEEALLYDAVRMFAEAIKDTQLRKYPNNISCRNDNERFSSGTSIINVMKVNLEYGGLTGRVKFNNEGFRTDFALDVTELREGGVMKVAVWNSSQIQPLTVSRTLPNATEEFTDIHNRTFIVLITLTEPYGMEKESTENLRGNDRYEGFAVDLIQELSEMRGFNYTIVVTGPKVGKYDNATERWTGIIGELREGRADLAITDLTITYEREEAVDFTSPFMMLGISILYQKPTKAPPSFFSFADPFAFEVWRLLMLACVGVSFILFIVGRISPSEWENPYPCIEEPVYLVNQLDLRNCAWFVTGSIMQQGSEIELKSIATRMVAGMWWFFTLLMVSSYTANLAAFLTTESPDPHFTNLKELIQNAEEKDIKFGAKLDGSTANFFRDKAETDQVYDKAWKFMKEHEQEVMVNETKDGVEKAAKEKYAFFMESSSIEYEIQRRCNLQQVNGLLDEKGYGIAMRKNESYRNSLSTAILILQNSGKIDQIKRRWWEERRGGGQCMDEAGEAEATSLNLKNVGGVFVVTIGGTVLALFMAILETIMHTCKKSIKTKTPFVTVLMEEIKFYFRFSEMVKPVYYGNSLEGSSESNKFRSEEKELPFDLVNKQLSVETLDIYANNNKSKMNRKMQKQYSQQISNNTC